MENFTRAPRRKLKDEERGASLVEYALLVALISIVCIGSVKALGGNIKLRFSEVAKSLEAPEETVSPTTP